MKTAIIFILFFIAFALLTYVSAITPGTNPNASYVILSWFGFFGAIGVVIVRDILKSEV